jgi:undecaprenyl-phosphate galactose phosphotransferase/putative colanic acid biosynthesis UDP-glucose lipid carrier transferase
MASGMNRSVDVAVIESSDFVTPAETRKTIRRRLPFHLIEPATLAGDLFVILLTSVLSGVGYQWFFLDGRGDAGVFLAIGALVFANFFALTSAQQNYRATNLINIGRQIRYVTLNWMFIFFILAAVAFTLKISQTFSRGSTLSFLAVGWCSLVLFRYALARYLKGALEDGAFAQQRIIVVSEQGHQNTSRRSPKSAPQGYRNHSIRKSRTSYPPARAKRSTIFSFS